METLERIAVAAEPHAGFARAVVGVDGSPEGLEAVRQAARLTADPLTLLSVYDPITGVVAGVAPAVPPYLDERPLRAEADRALEAAAEAAGAASIPQVARGRPWELLLAAIRRADADLVAVGSHGTARLRGIVIGSTATELVHKAPCSILVARTSLGEFPSRIVVGLDGSPESVAAYAVAVGLARRSGAELDPVVAYASEDVDLDTLGTLLGDELRGVVDTPVSALTTASASADLLVVGSRGLRGLKALGSVSERIAHQAASSVLIVRGR